MSLINKQQFLDSCNTEYRDVHIDKLGGSIRIKTMSLEEQISFEKVSTKLKNQSEVVYELLLICCLDENNNRLFDKQDLVEIKKKSANVLLEVFNEILKINRLDQSEIDDLAKN